MAYKEPGAGDVPMHYENRDTTANWSKWPGPYGGKPGPDGTYDPNSMRDPGMYDADGEASEWGGVDRRAGGPAALPRGKYPMGDAYQYAGRGKLPKM